MARSFDLRLRGHRRGPDRRSRCGNNCPLAQKKGSSRIRPALNSSTEFSATTLVGFGAEPENPPQLIAGTKGALPQSGPRACARGRLTSGPPVRSENSPPSPRVRESRRRAPPRERRPCWRAHDQSSARGRTRQDDPVTEIPQMPIEVPPRRVRTICGKGAA